MAGKKKADAGEGANAVLDEESQAVVEELHVGDPPEDEEEAGEDEGEEEAESEDEDDDGDEEEEDSAPGLVTVMIAGKAVQVTQEAAEAMAAASVEDDEDEGDDAEDEEKYERLFDTGGLQAVVAELKKEIAQELRNEYQADQGARGFWSNFYEANPELKAFGRIVRSVLDDNLKKWGTMPSNQVIPLLAKETQAELNRIRGVKPTKRGKQSKAQVEGSGVQRAPGRKSDAAPNAQPTRPHSLSDTIRQRRANRNTALRKLASN